MHAHEDSPDRGLYEPPEMNKKTIEHNLQRAEALFGDEKPGEANQLLLEALNLSNYNNKVSQDILFIYIEREMYQEALDLSHTYRNETKKDLSSDFTLEDIEKYRYEKEKKDSKYTNQDVRVFKKNKSMKSNLFFFIQEVKVSDSHIEFVFKNRTDRYPWASLLDSYISKKKTPRGPYSDTKDHIVLAFNNRKYKIRSDPVFEDLQDTNIFLKEIQKHCELRIQKKKDTIFWLFIVIGTLVLLLYLRFR